MFFLNLFSWNFHPHSTPQVDLFPQIETIIKARCWLFFLIIYCVFDILSIFYPNNLWFFWMFFMKCPHILHIHKHTQTYLETHTYIQIHIGIYILTYIIRDFINTYIHTYLHTFIHINTKVINTYTHTHIHRSYVY